MAFDTGIDDKQTNIHGSFQLLRRRAYGKETYR